MPDKANAFGLCGKLSRKEAKELVNNLLVMDNITKLFPGVKALDNVNLDVRAGEIHAICGENGAGKSTLMNVLSGVYPYGTYSGKIIFDGVECEFKNIKDSERLGIVIIHQELALIPYLPIAENVFLGNEIVKFGSIDWDQQYLKAAELVDRVGLHQKVAALVRDISVGEQQLVEIAKALSKKVRLLILDEPTAALNEIESANLLKLLLQLKKEGITCVIVSHKLKEIEYVADRITILRDGATIETLDKKVDGISQDRIIKGMVGRDILDIYPKRQSQLGDVMFEVKNWNVFDENIEDRQVIFDANLHVRKGEVVGLAGLMGAGRTELAMSIFGKSYGKRISGAVFKDSKKIDVSTVSKAISNKIAYATEDRKGSGLILIDTIQNNITLANLDELSNRGILDEDTEHIAGEDKRRMLSIKCTSVYQKAVNLSGGNQQKVVLGKWIQISPDVLILDEPTRGIDVGAKYEIYTIINQLASEGKSIILISSEMPELLGMSDRVYVVNQGRIVGEFDKSDVTQEKIMHTIMNSTEGPTHE